VVNKQRIEILIIVKLTLSLVGARMELQVWSEKYRPKKLSEVINQKHAVERIKAFVEEKNIPHMLFTGSAGVGKTATALALAHDLYGDNWRQNVLESNASD
jgi:replication factor C small subunit